MLSDIDISDGKDRNFFSGNEEPWTLGISAVGVLYYPFNIITIRETDKIIVKIIEGNNAS